MTIADHPIAAAVDAINQNFKLWPDDLSKRKAVEAHDAGRPAFWKTTSYHNQVMGNLVDLLNDSGDLEGSLKYIGAEPGAVWPRGRDHLLGRLIPLNRPAQAALEAAEGIAV